MSHAAAAPERPGSPAGRPSASDSRTRQDNRTSTHAFREDTVYRRACVVGRRTAVRFSLTVPSGIVAPTPTAIGEVRKALRRLAGPRTSGLGWDLRGALLSDGGGPAWNSS